MIIIVTGIPRSGTSMMMRMLEAGGVPCAYEQAADQFNPDGYYELPAAMNGDLDAVPDGHAAKCLHMLPNTPRDIDAKIIIMRRDIAVTITSDNRRAAARGTDLFPDNYGDLLLGCMDSTRLWCAGKPHVEVWYDDVLRNTPFECQRVARLLGFGEDGDRLARMIAVVKRP